MNSRRLLDRFLRYVKIDTMARAEAERYPSSPGQLQLGALLVDELLQLAARNQAPPNVVKPHGLSSLFVLNFLQANQTAASPIASLQRGPDRSPRNFPAVTPLAWFGPRLRHLPTGHSATPRRHLRAGCTYDNARRSRKLSRGEHPYPRRGISAAKPRPSYFRSLRMVVSQVAGRHRRHGLRTSGWTGPPVRRHQPKGTAQQRTRPQQGNAAIPYSNALHGQRRGIDTAPHPRLPTCPASTD